MTYTIEITEVGGTTVTIEAVNQTIEVNNLAIPPTEYTRAIAFAIDGGGTGIFTGSKGYLEVPFACVITEWTLVANQTGNMVVDIRKAPFSGFPTTVSITGTEKPTLLNALKSQGTDLSSWTTALGAGDILEYVVESSTSIIRATIVLKVIV